MHTPGSLKRPALNLPDMSDSQSTMRLCSSTSADPFEQIRSRFVGSMLGTFVGDALGMPLEGLQPRHIQSKHGTVKEFHHAAQSTGTFTDDTQMMVGIAEALILRRGFDGAAIAERFLANHDPQRGYGSGTTQALERLASGVPWDKAGSTVFGNGSFGNGSAMRVAPVGLLYHRNLSTAAAKARVSSQITHSHALGQAGAAVQALSIAQAVNRRKEGGDLNTSTFLEDVAAFLEDDESLFFECLDNVTHLLEATPGLPASADANQRKQHAEKVAAVLGNDPRSFHSVPTALYSFLAHPASFEDAMVCAISVGGDTDTIGAMTGALSGAYLGINAIPSRWLDGLEQGPKGHDYIRGLADDLFLLWLEDYSADDVLDTP